MTDLEKKTFDEANKLIETNKQIEEMTKDVCKVCVPFTHCETSEPCVMAKREAEAYYNLGYRKASDVAGEIFEKIEENTNSYKVPFSNGKIGELIVMAIDKEDYNKIKKKYMEGQEDNV